MIHWDDHIFLSRRLQPARLYNHQTSHNVPLRYIMPLLLIFTFDLSMAQETSLPAISLQEASTPTTQNVELNKLDPYRAVHEGNQLLLSGDPAKALDYYNHARKLKPDAREVDFVQGLGHYALEEYEDARQAFQRAAGGLSDSLADDALYSLGTAYHAEALSSQENPQLALSHLESAMRQYHNVLANNPDHQAAQDANLKAATMWRNIKQILEEQQQQQSDENKDQENEDNENKEDQQKQDQENQDQQDQDKQQQDQQNQDQDESDKKDQQQQSSENDKKEQDEKQQQAQAQQQEEVSREQAERKLREMMQALRDRKKAKRRQKQKIPFQPVDKDW